MPADHRTAARSAKDQTFWDDAFLRAWTDCIKQHELKGTTYCANLARDAADEALAQRRNSINGVQE